MGFFTRDIKTLEDLFAHGLKDGGVDVSDAEKATLSEIAAAIDTRT